MATIQPRQIQWGSALIEDATLTVELTGSASKAWRSSFQTVLALLETPHSSWGEVRLTKSGIKVGDLQQGGESELRHFLESIVLQANADVAPDTSQQGDGAGESHDEQAPDPDQQMTATFRGFAGDRAPDRAA
jgi:hypothetical protein